MRGRASSGVAPGPAAASNCPSRMDSPSPIPPGSGQRSLAAIVFTDVVSFSARMQRDEEKTLTLLRRDFELMRRICTQHHGAVLKNTGDGLLLYFSSAVQAVACALATQRALAEQARGRPAAEVLTHRLGIHLGDVFVGEQDVMGDGVNIAARLQAEAEPGGICISQTVYDVVRNKLELHVTRLGPRELKNISQSIPIYRLILEAQTVEEGAAMPSPKEKIRREPEAGLRPIPPTRLAAIIAATALVVIVAGLALRTWIQHRDGLARAEMDQAAFNALLEDDAAGPLAEPARVARTLADWRSELRQRRSRALEEYNFGELAAAQRAARTTAGDADATAIRAEVLRRVQQLFAWLATDLQRYNRAQPLTVRELTGTAPKEIRVYVGADRRLYYAEGGAVRQRPWTDLPPATIAAIVAGALIEPDALPSREAVQGARAFAALYNLPELTKAMRHGRREKFLRR
jgi:class 3 adenylate cyclase